ncbi:MAG: pyruvate kinase [Bacteroidales bacterium]
MRRIDHQKKTKIVATISDKNCSVDFLRALCENGMDVVRLNSAHQSTEDALKVIKMVREVSDKIAILIDTKGPEIRITEIDPPMDIKTNDLIEIRADASKSAHDRTIYVNYSGFVHDIEPDSKILIDDGNMEFVVVEKNNERLVCQALNPGQLKSRKSVNVPNTAFNLPSLNEKDKKFIRFAAEQEIDFIAHSFVRNREDVIAVQRELDQYESKIKIIAKIENQQGVDNLHSILEHAYGVMVARGDLAVEIPFERIPGVQRDIIKACNRKKKPVIVATQMLHSMIDNPRPTRAEVNDVASAIFRRTDAVMLSGETASGKYPVESVATMARIALEVEKSKEDNLAYTFFDKKRKIPSHLARYAVEASMDLNSVAIISDTNTGRTPRSLSSYHGRKPVFAVCYSKRTMRELSLSYGVIPVYMEPRATSHEFLKNALGMMRNSFEVPDDAIIIIIAGNFGYANGASYVEIGTVKNLAGE